MYALKSVCVFFLAFSLQLSNSQQHMELNEVLKAYQHKIRKISNREYTICIEVKSRNSKGNLTGLEYIPINSPRFRVGTIIDRSKFGSSDILRIGSFQSTTDTFELEKSDSLIIFSNPFVPRMVHIESKSNDASLSREASFNLGYFAGFSHAYLLNSRVVFETRRNSKNAFEIQIFDTISNKVTVIPIENKLPDSPCHNHSEFPN